jgi:hypothetical protein
VCANRESFDVSVFLGLGNGMFADEVRAPTGLNTGPYSVTVADFNLDGVPDLVTANFMSGTASVLIGNGDGTYEPPINAGPTGTFSYGIAAGDFNGDGKPDLATANAVSNDMTVKISTSR